MRRLITLALVFAIVSPALAPMALGQEAGQDKKEKTPPPEETPEESTPPPGLKEPSDPEPPPPPPSEPDTPGSPGYDPFPLLPPEEPEQTPEEFEKWRQDFIDLIFDLVYKGLITPEDAWMVLQLLR